jgi:pyruvate kinase
MNRKPSHTKIVATLGPATSSKEILKRMIEEGLDVFRLNFSHSSKEEHLRMINIIKDLNDEMGTHVAILADLQGPKLRIGEVENNRIDLEPGEIITFVNEKCLGTKERIYMSYEEFSEDVNPGEYILIDDGKLKLQVTETNKKDLVKAKVIYGGPLSSKKGVNLPNTTVSLPSLTPEDIVNVNFAIENEVDWIALSFVRKASDILDLKELIKKKHGHAGVIAKIEKPEALNEIDEIIDLTDGIMVARGDLGVEIPFDEVPLIQKMLVKKCIERSRPVIIATQMMESMINNFSPSRAEVTDVANAVLDGADALMLSGETSIGKYPVETIFSMQKIIRYTEFHGHPYNRSNQPLEGTPTFIPNSICYNAAILASQMKARAIVAFTYSGFTAFRLSANRPEAKIYAFTSNRKMLRKMSLVWGVESIFVESYEQIDLAIKESISLLKEKALISDGDIIVHIGSTPLEYHGRTNMIKVAYV